MNQSYPRHLARIWSHRREVAGAIAYWTGLGAAFELAMRPTGAIILMYHSVAGPVAARFIEPRMRISPEHFERQIQFLAKHRRVVALSRLVDEISSGASPVAGTVCITFDDGYLDNLGVAAPILEKYGLPATLYLATGYVERAETQWADVLYCLFKYRTADRLSVASVGLDRADLESPAGRAASLDLLHEHLLGSSRQERSRVLDEVARQLAPSEKPPRLSLNWDDVRELRRRHPSFEVGGHTRDHVDLRNHLDPSARAEIADCAADLRRELGIEPRHFAFPYERWNVEARRAVIESGWTSAVGEGNAFRIGAASDRFAMPRVSAPRTMTELRFKTSGAYPGVLSLLAFT